MYENLSNAALDVMSTAADESRELNHYYLGVEHLMLGLFKADDPECEKAFQRAGVDRDKWGAALRTRMRPGLDPPWGRQFITTPRLSWVVDIARRLARRGRVERVEPIHMLLAAMLDGRSLPMRVLGGLGKQPDHVDAAALGAKRAQGRRPSKNPELDRYSRDLCAEAAEGKLNAVVGREAELLRLAQVVSRRTKSNALLVGDAGVGKTVVVHGLAQMIVGENCPPSLKDKRVVELSLSALVGGTKYRGELESRLERLVTALRDDPDTIVFIDEIHTLVGAGSSVGGIDVGNALKPALADGTTCFIGATTPSELAGSISKDAALSRRFEVVRVEEPDSEQMGRILTAVRTELEKHHGVRIAERALERTVVLCQRYLADRRFPDKAIDVLDDACAQTRLGTLSGGPNTDGKATVDEAAVEKVVAGRVDISSEHLSRSDAQLVSSLEERLRAHVLGQDEAVAALADAVRVRWVGLGARSRPAGVFLFVGPTGVGKTELARSLAQALFGTERKLLRFDMSAYSEAHDVSKLLGAPPGYIGYEEGGQLSQAVRRNPHAVLLLDEIEKAHPKLYPVFLQVFDDGRLVDAHGGHLDFRNHIIILTSNLGSGPVRRRIGWRDDEDIDTVRERASRAVQEHFSPEFRNRIDRVLVFRPLTDAKLLERIASLALKQALEGLREERGVEVVVDDSLLEAIVARGTSPEFGARHLKRACFDLVMSPLSAWLLQHGVEEGTRLRIAWDDAMRVEVIDAA